RRRGDGGDRQRLPPRALARSADAHGRRHRAARLGRGAPGAQHPLHRRRAGLRGPETPPVALRTSARSCAVTGLSTVAPPGFPPGAEADVTLGTACLRCPDTGDDSTTFACLPVAGDRGRAAGAEPPARRPNRQAAAAEI